MKTPVQILSLAGFLAVATLAHAADSKRTAEYLLTTPDSFLGKEVTVDAAFVKPVHWVNPFKEIAFFQVMTMDRQDWKPGGMILAAINAADAEKFARKYGTDFKGRNDVDQLKGTFENAGGPRHEKIWIIDLTGGQLDKLIAERKAQLPDGANQEGLAGGPGQRKFGPGAQ